MHLGKRFCRLVWLNVLILFVGKWQPCRGTIDDLYTADELYGAERRAVDDRVKNKTGVLYFVHVHKAGGTTICHMARINNMRIPEPEKSKGWMGKNCNPRKEDKSTAWEGTVVQQVEYSRRMKINFFAIESALPAQLAWGHFAMLGVVRNPLKLMVSHCKWGGLKPNKCVEEWNNRHIFVYINKARHTITHQAIKKRKENFGVGNLISRGPYGQFGVPVYPVQNENEDWTANKRTKNFSEKDLDQAKHRLRRFSLVLVLERLHEAGPLLEAHFGWKKINTTTHRSGSHGNGTNALSHLNQSKLEALKSKLKLDFMLYEYASDLFDQQLELLARPP